MSRNVVRYCLSLALMACIAVLSLTPDSAHPGDSAFVWLVHFTPTLTQKVLHVCIYAALAFSLVWSLSPVDTFKSRRLLSFVIAVGFGAVMEWLQTHVPGRFGSLSDVLLNAFGALAGVAVSRMTPRRARPLGQRGTEGG